MAAALGRLSPNKPNAAYFPQHDKEMLQLKLECQEQIKVNVKFKHESSAEIKLK